MNMLLRSLLLFAIVVAGPAVAQQRSGDEFFRDTARGAAGGALIGAIAGDAGAGAAAGAVGGMLLGSMRPNR